MLVQRLCRGAEVQVRGANELSSRGAEVQRCRKADEEQTRGAERSRQEEQRGAERRRREEQRNRGAEVLRCS